MDLDFGKHLVRNLLKKGSDCATDLMDYRPDEKHLCAHIIRDPLVTFNVLDCDTLMTSLRSWRPLVLK